MPPARRSNAAAIQPSASRKLSLDAAALDAPAKRLSKAQLPQESDDDDDSDEAPEAQSNDAVRESVAKRAEEERSAIKSQKAARARAAQAREAAAASKSKKKGKAAEEVLEDAAASSSAAPSSSASRLDPALFASVFAAEKPLGGASSSAPTAKELEERRRAAREARREEREQLKRAGGVVRGREGEPMKRLKDGRTVVRALVPLESEVASDDGEERLAAPTSGPAPRPDAKARAFLKRRLGMAAKAEAPAQKKKPKKTTDDPLGLEDPAFMPGGEFYKGKSLTGKRARGGGAKPKPKAPGARTSASRSLGGPRGGPALAFAAPL